MIILAGGNMKETNGGYTEIYCMPSGSRKISWSRCVLCACWSFGMMVLTHNKDSYLCTA